MKAIWLRLSVTAASFLAVSSMALAQRYDPYLYGYGGGGGYDHASTLEEGALRGLGDLVRSTGAANLMNSEAAINYEDARSRNFDNRLKYTQTFFEMRRMNQQYREEERGPRPTTEDIYRYAKMRGPREPSESEVDPVTGTLYWPLMLQGDAFSEDRNVVEDYFAARAANPGEVTFETMTAAAEAIERIRAEMKTMLQANPDAYKREYPSAVGFIESLAYDVRRAPT